MTYEQQRFIEQTLAIAHALRVAGTDAQRIAFLDGIEAKCYAAGIRPEDIFNDQNVPPDFQTAGDVGVYVGTAALAAIGTVAAPVVRAAAVATYWAGMFLIGAAALVTVAVVIVAAAG